MTHMLIDLITYFCISVGALFMAVVFVAIAANAVLRAPAYKGPKSDHFDGARFVNLKGDASPRRDHGALDVLKWMLSHDKNAWERRAVKQTKPLNQVGGDGKLSVTFIGHATALIQTERLNIITDPVFAERASPVSWIGPKRFAAPGVAFDDLPPIDIVLLSHNHYDHMDIAALKRLSKRFHPLVIAPLGNAAFLEKRGIPGAIELDWRQGFRATPEVSIECVPAQHFSARAISDRHKTLWAGYVIKTPHGDIYFAGDTGYGPFAEEIAQSYPNGFRLGLLPVGAYEPQWFMREVHMSPDDAVALKKKLGAKVALAIHFGTWKLADDAQNAPVDRLAELKEKDSSVGRFEALPNGGTLEL